MHKHILDRPSKPSNLMPARFLAIGRKNGPHKPSLLLQRRPRTRLASKRAAQFCRIARD